MKVVVRHQYKVARAVDIYQAKAQVRLYFNFLHLQPYTSFDSNDTPVWSHPLWRETTQRQNIVETLLTLSSTVISLSSIRTWNNVNTFLVYFQSHSSIVQTWEKNNFLQFHLFLLYFWVNPTRMRRKGSAKALQFVRLLRKPLRHFTIRKETSHPEGRSKLILLE